MGRIQPHPNYLGARGWVWGGRYKLERYLYLLHRITGLGLILFAIMHLIVTTFFRISGQDIWEATLAVLENPYFRFGEYLVVIAFGYHALNGLRLIVQELGFALGKPTRPIYPYKDALRKKRPLTVAMIIIVIVLALVFLFDFITGGW